ncbi:hypothetical protein SAMN04488038_105277 [Solimonas aquatica]|uniref:DUF1365 domain-containing protein n=1 Tax=Solimonas aquatica TaxID=489703 RepID=A0A1H9F7I1_9GAMM|nr:DUF1365 domain-containing protein [Solimonas aquatica]SEQ33829.1 hypothetical protein SAMN04488038_105277 [Solimonas aquatica]
MNHDAAADGCLYAARVMHRRHVPPYYRFVYRVFYLLVDIDRLAALNQRLRFFSHNRFNLLSLHDADHGDGGGLRPWAEQTLRDYGLVFPLGRVRLLCFPRVLGMAFNPISLWYCEHAQGGLRAVIAEVRNTFGERHSYVLASGGAALPYGTMPEKDKCFHVSPFFDLRGRYRFVLAAPAAQLRVAIHETRDDAPLMDATLAGERLTLRDGEILRQVLAMPLLMLKVLGAIHWQALKLWLRGARFHRKPAPPAASAS